MRGWVTIAIVAVVWTAAGPARALREAQVEVSATGAGDAGTSRLETGLGVVSASVESLADGEARAAAVSESAGPFRSRSHADGLAGSASPSDAQARAAWYVDFVTTGIDPGGPVDLDLHLEVDGRLVYADGGTAGPGEVRPRVDVGVTIYRENGGIFEPIADPFIGSALLDASAAPGPSVLERIGDWDVPARDGDFSIGACSATSCQVDVDASIALPDAAAFSFGEVFAVEVQFSTRAHVAGGAGSAATADFLATGQLTLGTDAPGVVIAPVDLVQLPGLGPGARLALVGLLALGGLRAVVRRRVPRRGHA